MKRRLTNTTFFDGYTGGGEIKDESDTTVLLDYTGAGVWNEAQRKEALADAERYRRVREFLQRGDGLLDTRGMDDAGFDGMIDSLKECGK